MKLSPQTVRLRRIAKACAAGEFSQNEYRAARREVIVNFHVPRVGDDDTQTRQVPLDRKPQVVPPAQSRPGWLLWAIVGLSSVLALAAVQVFANPADVSANSADVSAVSADVSAVSADVSAVSADADIRPLLERDPNPATSPRLIVRSLSVANFSALPGVNAAAAQGVIDNALRDIRARNEVLDHGFTPAELDELGRFLNALGAHDETRALTERDARDLETLIAGQKLRRGLSVVELEEIAEAVQAYYRQAGYFLAVAYVPAQHVDRGSVDIEVLPGVLGDVEVHGGDHWVAARFADLVGQPLTRQVVASRLYALNEESGTHGQVSFEPGREVGETTLNIEVLQKSAWTGSLAFDNYGDEGTGEERLVAGAGFLNPTGRGDALNVGLLTSLDNADQLYGFVEYDTPVTRQFRLTLRAAHNDFSVNYGGLRESTDGQAWLYDVNLKRVLFHDRANSLAFEFGGSYHQLDWQGDLPGADLQTTQDVFFLTSAMSGHHVWDTARVAADVRLYADLGRIEDTTFPGQNRNFWDLGVDAFAWRPLDVPFLPGEQKVSAELVAQLSSTQLPSTRRLGLGGISGARGFSRDVYLADRGLLVRVDLRTPLSVGELSLFADAAYGETLNDDLDTWGRLVSVGVSWEAALGGIKSQLSWAVPVSTGGTGDVDDDGPQIFWSLRYVR